jgi:hypothetical protein
VRVCDGQSQRAGEGRAGELAGGQRRLSQGLPANGGVHIRVTYILRLGECEREARENKAGVLNWYEDGCGAEILGDFEYVDVGDETNVRY